MDNQSRDGTQRSYARLMKLIAEIILLITLGIMAYEDVKFRGISWFLFPLVLVTTVYLFFSSLTLETTVLNIGFVAIQLLLVTLYFTLKHKRLINITKSYFGWGDVLFLFVIALSFSTINFVFYYVFGLLISLFIGVLLMSKTREKTIPFAGIMSIAYITCFGIHKSTSWDMSNDYWLIQQLGW